MNIMNSNTEYSKTDIHLDEKVVERGAPSQRAKAGMILLHGRGAEAAGIISLSGEFAQPDMRYLAPQAAGRTWYPYPFTEPIHRNEPHLGSAMMKITTLLEQLTDEGIPRKKIVLLGFSQGACLALHYAALNPAKYGGIVSLSGGLIGDKLNASAYNGDLEQTPVFLGVGDNEHYFSLDRFHQSADILQNLNGQITRRVYPDTGHQITEDEVKFVRGLLYSILFGK